MSNVLVMMAAMVPTTGHRDIIEFARSIPDASVYVLVSDHHNHPKLTAAKRAQAISEHFADGDVSVFTGVENPACVNDWDYWREFVNGHCGNDVWDYVVASEHYGRDLAACLGAQFIPYDIGRVINNVRGEKVRRDIMDNWDNILPEFRHNLMLSACFFGQESVGKTTLARKVATAMGGTFIHEYARPYLITEGAEVTRKKMHAIGVGQFALQAMTIRDAKRPFACFDTDLFSTVGYWPIMGWQTPQSLIANAAQQTMDVYYLLPDDVPFEPDVLRYGGDVRESTYDYWLELTRNFDLPVVEVPHGKLEDKMFFIADDMMKRWTAKVTGIEGFVRLTP